MEVYEMPITTEESRNYHHVLHQLGALPLVEWLKTYAFTMTYALIIGAVIYTFSEPLFLRIWMGTAPVLKLALFMTAFLAGAFQHARHLQLRHMMTRFYGGAMPQDVLTGKVELKKIRVQNDRVLLYCRKYGQVVSGQQ